MVDFVHLDKVDKNRSISYQTYTEWMTVIFVNMADSFYLDKFDKNRNILTKYSLNG